MIANPAERSHKRGKPAERGPSTKLPRNRTVTVLRGSVESWGLWPRGLRLPVFFAFLVVVPDAVVTRQGGLAWIGIG